ncbi:MAG: hypothetical protein Q9209_001306 [Squamulea sp. 1 TL-2023]
MPSRIRMDNAVLGYLSLLLSGYDFVSETWANGADEKQRTVFSLLSTTKDNMKPHPNYWSVCLGSGTPGHEVQGFHPGIDTPFENPEEMHACCVELTSPVFEDTLEDWQRFATSLNKILCRLQEVGSLHERPRLPSTHRQLAWTNDSCKFHVTVRPTSERHHVSWSVLQNLFAVWETCAGEIQRLTDSQHAAGVAIPLRDDDYVRRFREALYAVPNLSTYAQFIHNTPLQDQPATLSKIALTTNVSGSYCTSLRFSEHRSTLHLPQLLFWTSLTYNAVLNCQSMAVLGYRFEASSLTGFSQFTEALICDHWVREYAWAKIRS